MASASATPEDHPLLIKPASLQTPSKALIPGELSIARTRGSWTPRDATAASPLHFPFASLTGALQRAKGKPMLRVPLATGPRVIVFQSVEDTDQVVDLLTPLIAREQQQGGGGTGGSAAGTGAGATGKVAAPAKADAWSQAKRKLLEEDKDLKAVYDQLVGGGALTESEFWRGRADRLSAAKAEMTAAAAAAAAAGQQKQQAPKTAAAAGGGGGGGGGGPSSTAAIAPGQRVGLASALLVEEASANRQGAANRATFRLTPELVLQIFAERPYVRAAYSSAVPRSCGEAEFWKRYLRYEAVRKARRRLRAAGRDPNEAGPEDELFRQFRAERRAEAFGGGGGGGGAAAAIAPAVAAAAAAAPDDSQAHIDPGVNLEADAADAAPPGYGLAHAGARDPSVGGGSAARPRAQATAASVAAERDAIVHELNRHAAVVLAGVPASLPSDAAAAAKALKEGPPTVTTSAAAAAAATAAAPAPHPPLSAAAAAAAAGSAATAAAAAAAQEREEHEIWRERAAAGLDDLRGAPQEEFEALTVADPRGYFCGGGGGGGEQGEETTTQEQLLLSSAAAMWSPEAVVSALRAPTKKDRFSTSLSPHLDVFTLFQSRDAVSALRDLAVAASNAGGDEAVSADDLLLAAATSGGAANNASSFYSAAAALAADPAAALPPPLLALLRQAALTANELLRHFWSSAATAAATTTTSKSDASKAAAAAARISRVVKALGTQYDRIQAMQSAASSGSERAAVRRLLAPVAAAIDAALSKAAALEEEGKRGGGAAVPMEMA